MFGDTLRVKVNSSVGWFRSIDPGKMRPCTSARALIIAHPAPSRRQSPAAPRWSRGTGRTHCGESSSPPVFLLPKAVSLDPALVLGPPYLGVLPGGDGHVPADAQIVPIPILMSKVCAASAARHLPWFRRILHLRGSGFGSMPSEGCWVGNSKEERQIRSLPEVYVSTKATLISHIINISANLPAVLQR